MLSTLEEAIETVHTAEAALGSARMTLARADIRLIQTVAYKELEQASEHIGIFFKLITTEG